MKTFLETLEQNKTNKIAHECFVLMAEKGINPLSYVAWLEKNDGLNSPNIVQESKEWLVLEMDTINEGPLSYGVGQLTAKVPQWIGGAVDKTADWVGQQGQDFAQGFSDAWPQDEPSSTQTESPVQTAIKALQDLSKRANRRGSSLQQSNIQQLLFNVLQNLQQMPTPQTPQTPNPSSTVTPSGVPVPTPQVSWSNYLLNKNNQAIYEAQINDLANSLLVVGIDPTLFTEWYINEGMHYTSIEQFEEGFLSDLWGGAKSWMQGKGFFNGMDQAKEDDDRKAAQSTLQAIIPLMHSGEYPQINQQLQVIAKQLQNYLWGQQQQQQQQQTRQPQNA